MNFCVGEQAITELDIFMLPSLRFLLPIQNTIILYFSAKTEASQRNRKEFS